MLGKSHLHPQALYRTTPSWIAHSYFPSSYSCLTSINLLFCHFTLLLPLLHQSHTLLLFNISYSSFSAMAVMLCMPAVLHLIPTSQKSNSLHCITTSLLPQQYIPDVFSRQLTDTAELLHSFTVQHVHLQWPARFIITP